MSSCPKLVKVEDFGTCDGVYALDMDTYVGKGVGNRDCKIWLNNGVWTLVQEGQATDLARQQGTIDCPNEGLTGTWMSAFLGDGRVVRK